MKNSIENNLLILVFIVILIFILFFKNKIKIQRNSGFWDEIYQGCLETSPREQCNCVFETIKKNYQEKESQFIYDMENENILDKEFARCYAEISVDPH